MYQYIYIYIYKKGRYTGRSSRNQSWTSPRSVFRCFQWGKGGGFSFFFFYRLYRTDGIMLDRNTVGLVAVGTVSRLSGTMAEAQVNT